MLLVVQGGAARRDARARQLRPAWRAVTMRWPRRASLASDGGADMVKVEARMPEAVRAIARAGIAGVGADWDPRAADAQGAAAMT